MDLETSSPAEERSFRTQPFLIGLAVFLIFSEIASYFATRDPSRTPDFRAFYAAGYIARTHPALLYDLTEQQRVQSTLISPGLRLLPFFHLSYEALLYLPFSLLPYRSAYAAFIAFNSALLLAVFAAAKPLFAACIEFIQPRPGLSMFIFLPLIITVFHGQDSILFLLLCCLALRQMRRGHDAQAGLLLAAGLFRFQLALPLAALLVARRGWRFCAGFIAGTAAVVAVCLAVVGPQASRSLPHLLLAGSLTADTSAVAQQAMATYPRTMPNLLGLLFAAGASLLPPHTAFTLVVAGSLAIFAATLAAVRKGTREDIALSAAVLCGVLVSYHLNMNDATLLLLPLLMAAQGQTRLLATICFFTPALLAPFGAEWCFLLAIPVLLLWFLTVRKAMHTPDGAGTALAQSAPLYT